LCSEDGRWAKEFPSAKGALDFVESVEDAQLTITGAASALSKPLPNGRSVIHVE
jgi:hypothetical protein